MTIQQFLDLTISKNASDLHLLVGDIPMLRVNGELARIESLPELTGHDFESLILPLLNPYQKEVLEKNWEVDLGLDFEKKARFRINIYKQKGHLAAAFRMIPNEIRKLESLGLPPSIKKITELHQGLILVTGPTGHGKTTTLASFINEINNTRAAHIITIEDPVEFVFPKGKSLISQRELNSDTKSWTNALRSALREDPDVVLVGELRDYETMAAAMTIAETGHLVFATLHTNSSAQTIDRIIDVFPVNQQGQIRIQLASVLEGVISQRLIPTLSPGRVMTYEIMYGTPALRSIIRDDKSHLIDNLIMTSGEWGMVLMEASLSTLVREGKISAETAINYSLRPQMMSKMLGNSRQYT
jgi:twitching motility protein PilT